MAISGFKQRCIELRKRGFGLNAIAQKLERSRTSVYFHIRDLPVTHAQKREWTIRATERIVRFNKKRKGISSLGRTPRMFSGWSSDIVMLIAHLLFDGEIKRYGCVYNNRSEALISRVERLMRTLYPFEPKRYQNPVTGVWRIGYYNVALGPYVRRKSQELLMKVTTLPSDSRRAFLQAFFDDEGCMDFRPKENKRMVRGYQKDIKVLLTVKKLLAAFGIQASFRPPNEIVIIGKENLARFQHEIGFSPGIYINGERTNSRWKEHIEKRELLRRAIASYLK